LQLITTIKIWLSLSKEAYASRTDASSTDDGKEMGQIINSLSDYFSKITKRPAELENDILTFVYPNLSQESIPNDFSCETDYFMNNAANVSKLTDGKTELFDVGSLIDAGVVLRNVPPIAFLNQNIKFEAINDNTFLKIKFSPKNNDSKNLDLKNEYTMDIRVQTDNDPKEYEKEHQYNVNKIISNTEILKKELSDNVYNVSEKVADNIFQQITVDTCKKFSCDFLQFLGLMPTKYYDNINPSPDNNSVTKGVTFYTNDIVNSVMFTLYLKIFPDFFSNTTNVLFCNKNKFKVYKSTTGKIMINSNYKLPVITSGCIKSLKKIFSKKKGGKKAYQKGGSNLETCDGFINYAFNFYNAYKDPDDSFVNDSVVDDSVFNDSVVDDSVVNDSVVDDSVVDDSIVDSYDYYLLLLALSVIKSIINKSINESKTANYDEKIPNDEKITNDVQLTNNEINEINKIIKEIIKNMSGLIPSTDIEDKEDKEDKEDEVYEVDEQVGEEDEIEKNKEEQTDSEYDDDSIRINYIVDTICSNVYGIDVKANYIDKQKENKTDNQEESKSFDNLEENDSDNLIEDTPNESQIVIPISPLTPSQMRTPSQTESPSQMSSPSQTESPSQTDSDSQMESPSQMESLSQMETPTTNRKRTSSYITPNDSSDSDIINSPDSEGGSIKGIKYKKIIKNNKKTKKNNKKTKKNNKLKRKTKTRKNNKRSNNIKTRKKNKRNYNSKTKKNKSDLRKAKVEL
jgi:hypothetical protein